MTDPPDPIVAEVEQAWAAVFGGPPAIKADANLLLRILIGRLPPAPPYEPAATIGQGAASRGPWRTGSS